MNSKISRFLAKSKVVTPCLVVDVDRVEENYRQLCQSIPQAAIYYAVKANPALPILQRLVALGAHFDSASKE